MTKILVVDDEQDLCEILQFNLSRQGYDVDVAYSAEEAEVRMRAQTYDLVLLDVMMEGKSGFELAASMKQNELLAPIPIIFCTAKDTEQDTLRGFGLGADDYIAKPFRISEVLARVKAVLNRVAGTRSLHPESSDNVLTYHTLRIDKAEKRIYVGNAEVALTRKEFDILVLLVSNAGHIFSRDDILARVWPDDVLVLDRSVDVCIARLRKKIGTEYARCIVSRSGYGYVFQS